GTFMLAAKRDGELIRGAGLSESALSNLATAVAAPLIPPGEPVHFFLHPFRVDRESDANMMRKLVSEVVSAQEAAFSPRPLAERAMGPPFEDFRLTAIPSGGDVVAQASRRNRVVYG